MKRFKVFFILTLLCSSIFAQTTYRPTSVYTTSPISIQKPIILDSVNSKDTKFSDEVLLSYNLNFPEQGKFSKEIKADKDGFFRLEKPSTKYAFQLVSFNITNDSYGKGKLKITSPNRLQVYINNEKKATKSTSNDSIQKTGSAEYQLEGFNNNVRVIIKLLTSSSDKINPAVKIELTPDKDNKDLVYTFNNQNKRFITIQDIVEGKRIGSAKISPSGRYVLLVLNEVLPGGERKGYTQIYDNKVQKIIFSETANRSQFNWLPKSDKLSYVSEGENGNTLYTLDPSSNEVNILAERLPKENFWFAPDEKSIFYTVKETRDVKNPKGLKRLQSPEDRQPGYNDRYIIYRYFFDSGLAQQITYGTSSVSFNDINADATKILFTVNEEDLTQRPFEKSSLYMADLRTLKIDTLWKDERFAGYAKFSNDGKKLLISGSGEAFNGIGLNVKPGQIANSYNGLSFIMNLNNKNIEAVTKNFDPAIASQEWSPKDNFIYYRVEDKDEVNMYRYSLSDKKFEKLPLNEQVIRSFDVSRNGEWASYTGVSQSNSARGYILNLKTLKSKLISDPYASRLQNIQLGEVKEWSFKSSFGDEIDGRYYLPPNFNPNKKYPVVVYYYGGTSPTQRIFESTYPFHVYAAQGFIVYTLNPSGTTGYGQEFAARHVNAWGKQTAQEIIEGAQKFAQEHSFVDAAKMGNIGASYGGFMTMYLATITDMFAASVSHAGISNIASYWGEGYWGYTYSSGASAGSYPWNNKQMYVEQSPLFNADKIKKPLLLLQGTADTNVPLGESIQMYTALKLLGKPVEYIQVDGENHAIYDYNKRIQWNYAIYAWFTKWLKGDSRWWDAMYPNK